LDGLGLARGYGTKSDHFRLEFFGVVGLVGLSMVAAMASISFA
jgi:hypothetical protein